MKGGLSKSDLLKLIELRKELHSVPELSGKEYLTSQAIEKFLKQQNPDSLQTGTGGYGIIATWDSGVDGYEILLRADMDALPIAETNNFDYRSGHHSVSHACGHDGHSIILCAVARMISLEKPETGKVRILFQPSEENGRGAKQMLEDKNFRDIHPDYVFALHNIPGDPLNSVVIREGSFSAAVNSMIVNLRGKSSHASEPEKGINPALAMSEILIRAKALENNNALSENMQLVTPVYARLGEMAYGTSAAEASVHLTLRCWHNDQLQQLENTIQQMSLDIASKYGLKTEFQFTETFYATQNDLQAVSIVRKAAVSLGLEVIEKDFPFKWGEDFGFFTNQFKGCMFGLGGGEQCPSLHHSDYDFPDQLIETGANIFKNIIHSFTEGI